MKMGTHGMRSMRAFWPLLLALALGACAHAGPRARLGAAGGAASGGLLAAALGGESEAIAAGRSGRISKVA